MANAEREEVVLVFDCGATNLKAVAVDPQGRIVAQTSRANSPKPQEDGEPEWLVWDLEKIWRGLCEGAREVSRKVGPENVRAVTVTTWGADGAPVKHDGTLAYPPISWQCPRTEETMKRISKSTPALDVFKITGYQPIPFNTLFKLIWLRENAPEALDDADTWLMMPGLVAYKLTDKFHIDPTSASTMMAMDLGKRDWSPSLLDLAGLDPSFFPDWHEPGQIVGCITAKAEKECSIPSGVPVVAGGHDTQFALLGSGARTDEAILSSGTWEILGVRSNAYNPSRIAFVDGLIIEADVRPGLWNPQLLMMGSGVLEWVLNNFFPRMGDERYGIMINEAANVPAGSEGLIFIPSFVRESGPTRKYGTMGTLLGLTLRTSRGQVVRSTLEGLSFQLKHALQVFTEATGIDVKGIRVVGGGARNLLWNQIRADVAGLPVTITEQQEYTASGAALVAWIGIGRYKSLRDARESVFPREKVFEPSANCALYQNAFGRYMNSLESLRGYYQS